MEVIPDSQPVLVLENFSEESIGVEEVRVSWEDNCLASFNQFLGFETMALRRKFLIF